MMTSSNGNSFRVSGPLCRDSPLTGEFPSQRPVKRSFDIFFDPSLNIRLSKQSGSCWFETSSHRLWCHCNVYGTLMAIFVRAIINTVILVLHQSYAVIGNLVIYESRIYFGLTYCAKIPEIQFGPMNMHVVNTKISVLRFLCLWW